MSEKVEIVETNAIIEIPAKSQMVPVTVNPYVKMIEMAMTSDVDMDKLERLILLKKEHEQDEARKAYFESFAAFKENPPKIMKSSKVNYKNKDGSFTKYNHADCGDALHKISKSLGPHGLSISFKQKQEGGLLTVTCFLTHRLGYQESTSLSAAPDASGGKNGIQGTASTDSYLKRYTAFSITGLHAIGEDDDGKTAQPKPEINNLVKMSPEYKALQETKGLHPELYQKMLDHFEVEPATAPNCKEADNWIKSEVDKDS